MSPREVTRAALRENAADIAAGRATVAVVPHTTDYAWAAEVTWDFCRALSAAGAGVTLVDLSLEAPALNAGATEALDEGIVDAFQYGASLSHVTAEQPASGLRFISAGTFPTDPEEIWRSRQWTQLLRSTTRPGAVTVLFVPEDALTKLIVPLDGVLVAAPSGYNPSSANASASINSILVSGVDLLAVVTGLVPPLHLHPEGEKEGEPLIRRVGRRVHLIYAIIAVLAVGSIGYSIFGRGSGAPEGASSVATPDQEQPAPPSESQGSATTTESVDRADSVAIATTDSAAGPPPMPDVDQPLDSLFWSVQAASLGSVARALEYVDRIEATGYVAAITPVRLGDGRLWYRVLIGTERDSAVADQLLRELWATPLLGTGDGRVVDAPFTLLIEEADSSEARTRILALRENGIPAYILPAAGGSTRIVFGAFRSEGQARVADSILAASGITTTSTSRLGISQ